MYFITGKQNNNFSFQKLGIPYFSCKRISEEASIELA
jgi:hypothetical protein